MKTRKFTALLLVLCLLLTAVPYSAPVHAVEEPITQEQTETQEETRITNETAKSTTAPLAEGIFFRFVDQAVFQSNGHVARVPEEETLSTYVFRNSDGTKTVYYLPDNVKYVAEDGTMVDKDLTLVSKTGGYGVTRSDIQYLLPTSAASGIRMTHGNKQVTMYPQAPLSRATAATVSGDSVRYDNYFGSGIHLVYTPIPSGLKEDIILDSYTGTSSFSFTIDTNGMRLYNDEGQYYFATSADAEEKIFLGDIIVYDAKGEPSAGTLTVTPVTMGQQYTLTVSADPAFLTDPDTVYPVTIDPTLTVSAATNSNFIEDATIYQNKPTTNAGAWAYNHCGYYASANTTYGACRTVYRLTGLLNDTGFNATSANHIASAYFYVREATGTAGVTVNLHAMTTNCTWTETGITWNNAGLYDSTVYATATPAYGNYAEYDITALVREWRNGTQNSHSGFVLISSNESSVDKAFYSAEFSATSYRPYVVVTVVDGLNYSVNDIDEGDWFRLQWPGVSSDITWTSNNTSIATVDGSGKVTGIKAGSAIITATADGYTSQRCTVHVTIPDGIYYIQNNLSKYFLSVDASNVEEHSPVKQQAIRVNDPTRFSQLWRITYMEVGTYSVRPVHEPEKPLSVNSDYTLDIQYTGLSDTLLDVLYQHRWRITWNQNGYVFKNGSGYMSPNSQSTAVNAEITASMPLTTSTGFRWSFLSCGEITKQMLLYDVRTHSYNDSIIRYVAPGETLTLSELGLDATFVTANSTAQPHVWESADSDVVSVNTVTGAVTGVAPGGTTTITVYARLNGVRYAKSYTIHVTLLPEGPYFIRNRASGKYIDILNQQMASGTTIMQQNFTRANSQKWILSHLGDGTYSIKSANSSTPYYMGVKNDSTATDHPVVLRTGTVTSGMKWKIAATSNGAYKVIPLTGETNNKVLALDSGSINANGTTLQQRFYVNDTNYKDEWYIGYANVLNLTVYYDEAYLDRYGSTSAAQEEILAQLNILRQVYMDYFEIAITFNTPTLYTTLANEGCIHEATDTCTCGPCVDSDGVIYSDIHHSNLKNILLHLDPPTGSTSAVVLYVGHNACGVNKNGECEPGLYDGLAYEQIGVVGINYHEVEERYTTTLIHEIGHLFLAPDHYYEEKLPTENSSEGADDPDEKTTAELNAEFKEKYGIEPFLDDCIYGKRNYLGSIAYSYTICEGCRMMICENVCKYFIP